MALGFTKAYISNITTGDKNVSGEVLLRISDRIPLANIDWLFHGRGVMLFDEYHLPDDGTSALNLGIVAQNPAPQMAAEDPGEYGSDAQSRLLAMMQYQQQAMTQMQREIDYLKLQVLARQVRKKPGRGEG